MDTPIKTDSPRRGPLDVSYTPAEYRAYAEAEARRMLNVSLDTALSKLDSGELDGTLAETRLKMIRAML